MAEYMRSDQIQWVDSDRCMIVDQVTGKFQSFQGHMLKTVGTFEDALATVKGLANIRYLIIRINCVEGFQLDEKWRDA